MPATPNMPSHSPIVDAGRPSPPVNLAAVEELASDGGVERYRGKRCMKALLCSGSKANETNAAVSFRVSRLRRGGCLDFVAGVEGGEKRANVGVVPVEDGVAGVSGTGPAFSSSPPSLSSRS